MPKKKKPARKPAAGKTSKTAFVLSQPSELTPREVVEAAAAQGIAISAKYVSNIRSSAKSGAQTAPAQKSAKAAPNGAPAAKRGRSPDGNKSEFIRTVPVDVKPAEVVRLAAAAGISIKPGLVHTVRSQLKRQAPPAGRLVRRGRPPKAVAAAPAPIATVGGDRERKLMSLALDIGLARSLELIAEIKTKLAGLI